MSEASFRRITLNSGDHHSVKVMSHEQMLKESGFDICSPISGSMRPMIRPNRDCVLFVRSKKRLKKYDIALYRTNEQTVMHRVLKVLPEGYLIRGDNTNSSKYEYVKDEQIIGVMQGFYRDKIYIEKENIFYSIYARLWPRLHPLLKLYKWMKG